MLRFIGVPPGTSWSTFWGVVLRAAVVAGVLVAVGLLLSLPTPLPVGHDLLDAVAGLQHERLTTAVRSVSGLGNVWVVGVGAVAVGVIVQVARPSIAGEVRLLLLSAYGGALVITAPLKLLTARARPSGALVGTLSSAYPSGHALRTAAVYGLLAWLLHQLVRSPALRLASVCAVIVLAVAIATARVYLWVHWPSDVAVGLLLGGGWVALLLRVTAPLRPVTGRGRPATELPAQ